jgi:hypothetical protein
MGFDAVSGRAWLGIAILLGSPSLSSSASPVPGERSSLPRPHGFKISTNQRLDPVEL